MSIEILSMQEPIEHKDGTKFEHTFELTKFYTNTNLSEDFPLTDYDGEFEILETPNSTVPLYKVTTIDDPEKLVFTGKQFKVEDLIEIGKGSFYFIFRIKHKTDATGIHEPYIGPYYSK